MATSRKRNVTVDVVVDDKKARAGLKNVEQSTGKLEAGFGKLKGAVAGVMAAFGAREVIQFAGDTVRAASDLGESLNAVNVTFGDSADGIKELGEQAAESVGLSNSAFNSFAVGFSAFAEAIADVSGADVVDVVDSLTTRIADFASVMNLEVPEAAEKFRSGLAGETEPLRQFGIDVSAAAVTAKALEMGLADSSSELSEQDKILARYEVIMDQTDKTAGDFKNTSDELANSQRILKARFEDAKAELGQKFIPVVEDAVEGVIELLDSLEQPGDQNFLDETINDYGEWGQALKDFKAEVKDIIVDMGLMEPGIEAVSSKTAELSVEMDKARHETRDHSKALEDAAEETDDFADATDDATSALDHFESEIRGQIDPVFALASAIDDVEAAQKATTEAADEHGKKSPEYRDALRQEALKWLDLKAAQIRVAEQAGFTREQFETHLRNMTGLTEEQVDLIIAEFERINAFKFTVPTIRGRDVSAGGSDADRTFRGGRARGGSVRQGGTYLVGEEGPELLHMGSGSGTVIPNDKISTGGGGVTIIVQGYVGSEAQLAQELDRLLTNRKRRNGLGFAS